jgi:hypothetical protein
MKKLVSMVPAGGRTADELVDLVMAELILYREAKEAGLPAPATDRQPSDPIK